MEILYCEAKQVVEQLTALLGLIATLMILISVSNKLIYNVLELKHPISAGDHILQTVKILLFIKKQTTKQKYLTAEWLASYKSWLPNKVVKGCDVKVGYQYTSCRAQLSVASSHTKIQSFKTIQWFPSVMKCQLRNLDATGQEAGTSQRQIYP